MGLPIKRFVAANNRNDVFLEYLHTGVYTPRPSVPTIANAMDVGDPSNFARILDLYGKNGNPHAEISQLISGYRFTDEEIGATMKQVYNETGYVLDPHGACGYQALIDNKLAPNETGLFLETAHPAKFKGTVDKILDADIEIPAKLKAFMQGEKQSVGWKRTSRLSKAICWHNKHLAQKNKHPAIQGENQFETLNGEMFMSSYYFLQSPIYPISKYSL